MDPYERKSVYVGQSSNPSANEDSLLEDDIHAETLYHIMGDRSFLGKTKFTPT